MNTEKHIENGPKKNRRLLHGFVANIKRFWFVLLVVGVAAVVLGLMAARSRAGSDSIGTDETFAAKKSDLTITVMEGGSIRAKNSVEYKCQVQRRSQTTILSVVPVGTYVTAEDVKNGFTLIQLDSSTLKDDLNKEQIQLASEQENFTSAQAGYDIQVKQNESDIAASEMNVRFALMDLQKFLGAELANGMVKDINDSNSTSNLSRYIAPIAEKVRNEPNLLEGSGAAQQLKKCKDDITLGQGNLTKADSTLKGTQILHDANYVSDLDLQGAKLSLQSAKFQSENCAVSMDLFLRYDFPKSAEQYLSTFIESRRGLARTYAQCRARLAQAQIKLTMAEQRLKNQKELVAELSKQIEYCTIKAKAPGLVVYGTGGSADALRAMRGGGGGGNRSGLIAEGEPVSEGQTLISMPDTAEMVAEIAVHETDVDKVRVGQPATIVMDAFPDRVLQGKVIEVAPLPDDQRGWMNPDLKVYKTLVSIEGSHDFLKTRMSCMVKILVEQLTDVIVVPVQTVANRGGKKVCYVMASGGAQERQVETGLFNDTFVHVVSGLEPGENVMLNPPLITESSSPTTLLQQPPMPQGQIPRPDPNDRKAVAKQGRGPGRQRGPRGAADVNQIPDNVRKQMEELKKLPPDEQKQKMQQFRNRQPGQGGQAGQQGAGADRPATDAGQAAQQ